MGVCTTDVSADSRAAVASVSDAGIRKPVERQLQLPIDSSCVLGLIDCQIPQVSPSRGRRGGSGPRDSLTLMMRLNGMLCIVMGPVKKMEPTARSLGLVFGGGMGILGALVCILCVLC